MCKNFLIDGDAAMWFFYRYYTSSDVFPDVSWQMVEYLGSSNLDYLSFFHVTDLHLEKALSPIHLAQKGIDKTISTTAIVTFIFLPTSQLSYFFIIICKNMNMTL